MAAFCFFCCPPHPPSWIQHFRWKNAGHLRASVSFRCHRDREATRSRAREEGGARDLSKPRVRWREPRREPQVCEGGRGAQDDNGLWRDLRTCCDRILRHVQVAGRQFGRGRVPQTPQIVLPAHALHVCYGVPSPMRRRLRRDTESTIRVKRRYRPSWRRSKSVEPSLGSFSTPWTACTRTREKGSCNAVYPSSFFFCLLLSVRRRRAKRQSGLTYFIHFIKSVTC